MIIDFEKVMLERFINFSKKYLNISDELRVYPLYDLARNAAEILVVNNVFSIQKLQNTLLERKIVLPQAIYDYIEEVVE